MGFLKEATNKTSIHQVIDGKFGSEMAERL